MPQWKDAPDGVGEYSPSTNIPPTAYTPILVNGERVILIEIVLDWPGVKFLNAIKSLTRYFSSG